MNTAAIPWAVIRAEYEAGTSTNSALARRFGCSEGTIRNRARDQGWQKPYGRPPAPRPASVGAEAAAAAVGIPRSPVTPTRVAVPRPPVDDVEPSPAPERRAPKSASDKREVDTVVDDLLALADRMLDELDAVTSYAGELEALIIDETHADLDKRRRQAMLKAVSLPTRASTLKTIMDTVDRIKGGGSSAAKLGKKAQQQDAAGRAAAGKFAPAAPPSGLKIVGVV